MAILADPDRSSHRVTHFYAELRRLEFREDVKFHEAVH